MSRRVDVLVAGSGMAGLVAALTAAHAGCSVRLISAGMGSLALSGGNIDLLGYVNGKRVPDPWQGMQELAPGHPYRLLGESTVRAALEFFQNAVADSGWPMHTGFSNGRPCNTDVPTILGTLKPTWLLPAALDPAVLQTARRVLVASIHGLRDCRPSLVIGQLRRYRDWAEKSFTPALLPAPGEGAPRSITALDMARLADKPHTRQWLLEALAPYAGQYDLVLLPPVCGSGAEPEVFQAMSGAVGCPVMEMLSIPPGVGGLRLRDALLRCLNRHDFMLVENATVLRAETADGMCTALLTDTTGGERRHAAKAFVLATGGVLGGGIAVTPGKIRESVFGMEIPVPPGVAAWSEEDVFGNHAFSRMGVSVDGDMRPVGQDAPQARNVFFAGRSIGGYDFSAEKSGHGVAIATGWQAGRAAAAVALAGEER